MKTPEINHNEQYKARFKGVSTTVASHWRITQPTPEQMREAERLSFGMPVKWLLETSTTEIVYRMFFKLPPAVMNWWVIDFFTLRGEPPLPEGGNDLAPGFDRTIRDVETLLYTHVLYHLYRDMVDEVEPLFHLMHEHSELACRTDDDARLEGIDHAHYFFYEHYLPPGLDRRYHQWEAWDDIETLRKQGADLLTPNTALLSKDTLSSGLPGGADKWFEGAEDVWSYDIDVPQDPEYSPSVIPPIDFAFTRPQRRVLIPGRSAPPTPQAWIAQDFIPLGEAGVIFGVDGAGKSALMADLAASCAVGAGWMGHDPSRPIRTAIWATESAVTTFRRLQAWAEYQGIPFEALRNVAVIDQDLDLNAPDAFSRVVETLSAHQPRVVIFDTLAKAMQGDENGPPLQRAFDVAHAACQMAARGYPVTTLHVHHPGHDGERERGFSGLRASAFFRIRVADSRMKLLKLRGGIEGIEIPFALLGQDLPDGGNEVVAVHGGETTDAERDDELLALRDAVAAHAGASYRELMAVTGWTMGKVQRAVTTATKQGLIRKGNNGQLQALRRGLKTRAKNQTVSGVSDGADTAFSEEKT